MGERWETFVCIADVTFSYMYAYGTKIKYTIYTCINNSTVVRSCLHYSIHVHTHKNNKFVFVAISSTMSMTGRRIKVNNSIFTQNKYVHLF